jgi:hypothetical protein
MNPINAKRERGAALLALVAAILLAASWLLVSRLNAESAVMTAVNRTRNAEVLNRAKLALIGYVTQQAATSGERNPGRLPCPEAVNSITQRRFSAINRPARQPRVARSTTSWRTLAGNACRYH